MRSARIHHFGGPEVITFDDLPVPRPGPGELRVRVHASSVNPVDYKIRQGGYMPEDKLPIALGRDISGVVDDLGEASDAFGVGDAVMAMLPMQSGGNADFVVLKSAFCAPKPLHLEHERAAALGLAALTAWQGLFDHGRLTAGQSVLIHGGAGGVGHLAVQFAHARGAHVIATCGPEDLDFVRGIGADQVIDYKARRFEDEIRDTDLVYDLIAGETRDRSWQVIKRGGTLVTTLPDPDQEEARRAGVRAVHYMAHPDGAQLREIGRMADAGTVVPTVTRIFPLHELADAHRLLEQGHVRGKIVLSH